jgi:alpha-mannosidase
LIANGHWRIDAKKSRSRVTLTRATAKPLVLRVVTIDDPWGSWGGHDGEIKANHVNDVKTVWTTTATEVIERGPERAALWVRLAAGASWLELTFQLYRNDPAVVVRARAFWAEKAARLKLQLSTGGEAEFEVPGGTVRRQPCGEVPGGRWVRFGTGAHALTFASDALYNFDVTNATFGATVVRSCRYAANNRSTLTEQPSRPYMDLGEHVFQFALASGRTDSSTLAARLESPPLEAIVPARAGEWPRTGGVLRLSDGLQLLAFARAESSEGWLLRVQNTTASARTGTVDFLGSKVTLGRVAAWRIHSVLLQQTGHTWSATAVNAAEEPIRSNTES